jgi:pSer/pThr/pTyr-binding forkhead associated (FHA) protein
MILFTIGRELNNKYIITKSDDPNKLTSNIHAEIYIKDDGSISIIDKSANGTTVNGRRINKEVETTINRGDKVEFAGVHQLNWNRIPVITPPPAGWNIYSFGTAFNNRIQLTDPTNNVSRYHATLKIDPKGKMFINDHSTNGTYVNGSKIPTNQDYSIKQKDKVSFANVVPLDWNRIKTSNPSFPIKTFISSVAAVLVIAFGIYGFKNGWFHFSNSPEKYQSAVVLIYNEYYYTVEFDDEGAGESIVIGYNGNDSEGEPNFVVKGFEGCHPFGVYGTGFFVSKDGKIATNRHVAMPWEYMLSEKGNDKLRDYIELVKNQILKKTETACLYYFKNYKLTQEQATTLIVKLKRIGNCRIKKITGYSSNLRIGYSGEYYESLEKFDPCIFIDDSKDKGIDVALLQRYNKKLPNDNIQCVNTKEFIPAENLKVGDVLTTIGYPSGPSYLTLRNDDGGLKNVMKKGEISRTPGKIEIDFNIEVIGGASGSPLFDQSGNFIGIVSSRFVNSSTNGKGVLGKYVAKLIEDNK